MEEDQIPPRIYLVHNNPDPLGPNGEEGKPEGWGLPGGGNRDEDEKPYEDEVDFVKGKMGGTVRREVLGESGLWTEIATRGDTEFGEVLFEYKPDINNDIFIFHLKKVDGKEGFRTIEETSETRRVMLADLGSILIMPSAIKITRRYKKDKTLESIEVNKNPEGIYFSTRERIFGVLEFLRYDFYRLIPDLDKLFPQTRREEVGNYVYNLLSEVVKERQEVRERRAKLLRPDVDELLERYQPLANRDELWERYQPWIMVETAPTLAEGEIGVPTSSVGRGIECQK